MPADTIGGAPPPWTGALAIPIVGIPVWGVGPAVPVPGTGGGAFDPTPALPVPDLLPLFDSARPGTLAATDPGYTTAPAIPILNPPSFLPTPPTSIAPGDYWTTLPPNYIPIGGVPMPVTTKGLKVTVGGEDVTVGL